jgi:hypothetical protein
LAVSRHDCDSELALAEGIQKCGISNTTALLFTPDRSYKLKLASIQDLTHMSQRVFERDEDGKTTHVRLWQQSGLGVGRVIKVSDIIEDDEHDQMPAARERAICAPGADGTNAGDAPGGAARPTRPARARGGADRPGLEGRQLHVRLSKKGLSLIKEAMAQRRDDRRRMQQAERDAEAARVRARRLESGCALWCRYQPTGLGGCGYYCFSERRMARHLAKPPAKHRTRLEGGHVAGTLVDGRARIAHAAAAALESATEAARVVQPHASGLAGCKAAAGFTLKLLSGREVQLPPPKAGWACFKQLPATKPNAKMYH